MIIKKLLKYILLFSTCMIILTAVPRLEIECNDKYYITLSICSVFLLLEIFMPTYKVNVDKTTDNL